MLVDASRPAAARRRRHPGDRDRAVHASTSTATSRCERFRVVLEGTAEAHADHSAPLRGEAGRAGRDRARPDLGDRRHPLPVAPRHPLRDPLPGDRHGAGSARRPIALSGPGQRDHSWGGRDWWASDWMWSALHLDDGTHTHAVTVPTHPDFGVGYVQRGDGLTELGAISSTAEVADDGLTAPRRSGCRRASSTSSSSRSPSARSCSRRPTAASRTSRARCAGPDGRRPQGLGWVEWNRNQP